MEPPPAQDMPADAVASEDRRKTRGARSRAKILEHAAAIASVEGLEGLTIGRLACEAGVAKGNIQVLFGDKQALQLAVIDWVGDIHDTTIVAPAMREAEPLAALMALIDGWFAFVQTKRLPGGCFMNAVSSEYRARPGPIRDRVAGRRREKRERYARLLAAAKEDGELRGDVDPEALAFELLAFQALANIALTSGDTDEFSCAQSASHARLAAVRTARAPPPSTSRN